jgi:hypothetical protein
MPFYENAFDEDDKRRTGLQARSQIGRVWRPDLHYRSRSFTDRSGLETRPTLP